MTIAIIDYYKTYHSNDDDGSEVNGDGWFVNINAMITKSLITHLSFIQSFNLFILRTFRVNTSNDSYTPSIHTQHTHITEGTLPSLCSQKHPTSRNPSSGFTPTHTTSDDNMLNKSTLFSRVGNKSTTQVMLLINEAFRKMRGTTINKHWNVREGDGKSYVRTILLRRPY